MKSSNRFLTMAAVAATLPLLMSGCGSSTPTSESATSGTQSAAETTEEETPSRADADLVIWGDGTTAPAIKAIAEAFAKENGITVAVQTISGDLQANFITADSSGKGPDIVLRADSNVAPLVENGSIVPLNLSAEQQSQYEAAAIEGLNYQGKIWALPYALESVFLLRNTALAPEEPTSFENMVSTGQKLVDDGKADRVLDLPVGENGDFYHAQALFSSAGGYIFGTTASGDADTSDIGVAKEGGLTWAKKMAEYGEAGSGILTRSVSADNAISLFTQGKTPYIITGPWALPDIKTAGIEYEIGAIPQFEGLEEARPFVAVQGLFIAAHSQNSALAQEFVLNTMGTVDGQVALSQATNRPPAMVAAMEKVEAGDPDISKINKVSVSGVVRPKIPEIKAVWAALGAAQAEIIGGADPQKSMDSAAATIASKIK